MALAALTWFQTAHWHDAVTLFRHALALDRDNPLAHNGLGMALAAEGRDDEAVVHFREALRAAPEYSDALGNLAFALARRGSLGEAERLLRDFLEFRPEEPAVLNELGSILIGRERAGDAIPFLERSIRVVPGFAIAHYNLSRALAAVRRSEEAAEHARRAEQLGYRAPEVYGHLAWLAIEAGRFDEARVALETLVRLRPDYAPARANLAAVYARLGRPGDARREIERARPPGGDRP